MSIGIGPFRSKSPAVSSSVSKSRSKPSEEAEWSAGGLTSNGRRDSDVVCPRSPQASRGRSGVPGVCSRTLGGLIPNALGMSPVTFMRVRSVAAASTRAAARKGSKIFPSGHSTAEASAMTARVRCAEVVSSPLGTRAMRTGSFRTTRAMRRAESGVSTCGARRESDRRGRAANKEPSVKSDGISVKCPFEKYLRGRSQSGGGHVGAVSDFSRYFYSPFEESKRAISKRESQTRGKRRGKRRVVYSVKIPILKVKIAIPSGVLKGSRPTVERRDPLSVV